MEFKFQYGKISDNSLVIFIIILVIVFISKLCFKEKPSPILMIVFSAGLGMLLYGM